MMRDGHFLIASHHIELNLPRYGDIEFGIRKLPNTYSREWRKLREQNDFKDIDIEKIEEKVDQKKETTWKIVI